GNGSAITSDEDVAKKAQVTYTWRGVCQNGINFFIYVLRDLTDARWSYTRTPCRRTNVAPTSTAVPTNGFTTWSEFGQCSVTCGEGVQERRRTCELEQGCNGVTVETRSCQVRTCPGTQQVVPCLNRFVKCGHWARTNQCRGNFGLWMQRNCAVSCGAC
uniref:ShKT domain-containing protein n=1 Tax=Ciona savignyi TaxID=51511 RepID=H2YNM4_CIOSA